MQLTAGARLRSQACTTEVIVIKAPDTTLELGCGGAPLVTEGAEIVTTTLADGLSGGSLLGKRYTTAQQTGLELLVVKAGEGTLTADGERLVLKEAKPLPASD